MQGAVLRHNICAEQRRGTAGLECRGVKDGGTDLGPIQVPPPATRTVPPEITIVSPDGLITDWNAQAERIFGWTKAEAVGRELTHLIVPEDKRAAHDAGFHRYAKTGFRLNPTEGTSLQVSLLLAA